MLKAGQINIPSTKGIIGCLLFLFLSACSINITDLTDKDGSIADDPAPVPPTDEPGALAPSLSYDAATGTSGFVGVSMNVAPTSLAANGSAITSCHIKSGSTTALPAWATINSSTCVISGTPTAALTSTVFSVVATNAIGTSNDAAVTLSAIVLPLSVNAPSISLNIHSGQQYTFVPLGGIPPYTFTLTSGTGSINSAGVFTAGTTVANSIVQIEDSEGESVSSTVHHYYAPVSGGNILATALDSAGNKYIGGSFTTAYPYHAAGALALRTTDGAPALEFDIQAGFNDEVYAMLRGPNGEIYVGGNFTSYKGVTVNRIAKLDKFGNLDTSFHAITGGFDRSVRALALNSTGTILYAGGTFTIYRGVTNSARYIAKLSTSDGAIDTDFHPVSASGGFDDYVSALALNSTGTTLYVGGAFTSYRGVANSAGSIAKLSTSDGAIDTAFHPNSVSGGFNDASVRSLVLNSDGTTLYVGGYFTSYRGLSNSARRIAKLSTTNGAIDTTFHPRSASGGFDITVESLALNSTGTTLYVGGQFNSYRGVTNSAHRIAKLSTSNGAIDTTFHPVSASGGFDGFVHALALSSDGNTLYAGGSMVSYRGAGSASTIAKLSTSNGAIDTTFHPPSASGGFNSYVISLLLHSNGETLYVGGVFKSYRGVPNSARYIAKLLAANGAIDTNFHPVSTTGGFDGIVFSLALNSDGTTLYVGGSFSAYRGVANSARRIAKLSTSNGALDTTFHPISTSGGFDTAVPNSGLSVYSLALNSDGTTLYVGGHFNRYRGVSNSAHNIAKLSTIDGTIDTTFHPNSASGGFDYDVNSLALNSTGTILYAGGTFTSYRGVSNSARTIAKLSTSDGAIDTTFHPVSASGGFDSTVQSLALDSAGTILFVGGGFSSYRGVTNSASRIAKLSTIDGAIDTTFHPVSASSGFNATAVWSLALNSLGTILYVGGDFTTYRGVADSANRIAKLSTSNGAIDTTFHPVSASNGFNDIVRSLVLNSDGTTLYLGGHFGQYEGEVCHLFGSLNATNGSLLNP